MEPSALPPNSDAESSPARWWAYWKTYAPTCLFIGFIIGFHLIKFPMMYERIEDGGVYSVKALHVSGVPVPNWSNNSERIITMAIYHPAVVRYQIEKGAKVNVAIRLVGGWTPPGIGQVVSTPLMAALTIGSVSTTRLLIERGADVHAQDSIGRTPMTVAITYCPRAIELLLASGVDINEQTRFGTPLLTAARYQWFYSNAIPWGGPMRERDNAVRILLEKGADPA
jgi:ankyrin repeat protein